jgi:hypothetical protein
LSLGRRLVRAVEELAIVECRRVSTPVPDCRAPC